jgi:hypothetical protein
MVRLILCLVFACVGCIGSPGDVPVAESESSLLPASGDNCWCAGYGYRCCKAAHGDGIECGGSGLCLPPPAATENDAPYGFVSETDPVEADPAEDWIEERYEIRPDQIVPIFLDLGAERPEAESAYQTLTATEETQGLVSLSCYSSMGITTCCVWSWLTTTQYCVTKNTYSTGQSYYTYESGQFRCRRGRECI